MMHFTSLQKEAEVALDLARRAAAATEKIRERGLEIVCKQDGSPLTQADAVSQAIILAGLKRFFPQDRIAAEEYLQRGDEARGLWVSVSSVLESLGMAEGKIPLEAWINYRGNPAGRRVWLIDPIDGTKGFQRGLCYAVVLGLFFEGRPRFGCMAVPGFPDPDWRGKRTVVAYGGTGEGAFLTDPDQGRSRRLRVSPVNRFPEMRLLGSRAHDREDLCIRLMKKTGITRLLRMDGEAKYLMLAAGRGEVYARTADPDFGIGFPWDHCAGQVILEEAGGVVSDFDGRPLPYKGPLESPMKDLQGLVASNGRCHRAILDLVSGMA